MSPNEFTQVFTEYVESVYNGPMWLLLGETKKGIRPIGFVTTFMRGRRVLEIGAMEWFPWASARSILEAVVNLFEFLKEDYTVLEFAHEKDQSFFRDHVFLRGSIRFVGEVIGIYADSRAYLWQTRRYGDWATPGQLLAELSSIRRDVRRTKRWVERAVRKSKEE